MEKKYWLTDKIWAKTVAYVLFCISMVVTILAGLAFALGVSQGWYADEYRFEDTFFPQECAWIDLQAVGNAVREVEDVTQVPDVVKLNPAFQYQILDIDGNVLVDTTTRYGELVARLNIGYEDDDIYFYGDTNNREDAVPLYYWDGYDLGTQYELLGYVDCSYDVEYVGNYALAYENFLFYDQVLPIALPAAGIFGAVSLALFIFLMCSAGKNDGRIELRGFDRLPADLYAAVLIVGAAVWAVWCYDMVYFDFMESPVWTVSQLVLIIAPVVVLALALCMTFAARWKTDGWWKCTVIYWVLKYTWKAVRYLWNHFPVKIWFALRDLVLSLSVTWRTLLLIGGLGTFNVMCFLTYAAFPCVLALLLDFAVLALLMFFSWELHKVQKGCRALAEGDLNYTVDTEKMRTSMKKTGEDLNSISAGLNRAVAERIKSERMKTELITNVSHDIKTPLTSIISYLDLLKKEELNNDKAKEYVEVLERQSLRLKKLTEDVVEASKAATGSMAVNLLRTNVGELLEQASGEYAERLNAAGLTLIVNQPKLETEIMADSRLLSRVFDNLFSNVCKYALSGTRVYLSAVPQNGEAVISLKNISAQVLNISSSELMERFVQGDPSRSSEGSGLGLSIAQSLTELQGGRMELEIDGDLFKVTLYFPAAVIQ